MFFCICVMNNLMSQNMVEKKIDLGQLLDIDINNKRLIL